MCYNSDITLYCPCGRHLAYNLSTDKLGFLAILFGHQLLGIYSPSEAVIQAGMVRMLYLMLFYGLDALMDVQVGSIRGIGYNIAPMLVTLVGACLFRLVWLGTVFQIPAYHTIEMVYIVYPISWVITSIAHMIAFHFAYRRTMRHVHHTGDTHPAEAAVS